MSLLCSHNVYYIRCLLNRIIQLWIRFCKTSVPTLEGASAGTTTIQADSSSSKEGPEDSVGPNETATVTSRATTTIKQLQTTTGSLTIRGTAKMDHLIAEGEVEGGATSKTTNQANTMEMRVQMTLLIQDHLIIQTSNSTKQTSQDTLKTTISKPAASATTTATVQMILEARQEEATTTAVMAAAREEATIARIEGSSKGTTSLKS